MSLFLAWKEQRNWDDITGRIFFFERFVEIFVPSDRVVGITCGEPIGSKQNRLFNRCFDFDCSIDVFGYFLLFNCHLYLLSGTGT